jgi:hypothetical protein
MSMRIFELEKSWKLSESRLYVSGASVLGPLHIYA